MAEQQVVKRNGFTIGTLKILTDGTRCLHKGLSQTVEYRKFASYGVADVDLDRHDYIIVTDSRGEVFASSEEIMKQNWPVEDTKTGEPQHHLPIKKWHPKKEWEKRNEPSKVS